VPRSRVELCAAIRRDAQAGMSGRTLRAQVLRGPEHRRHGCRLGPDRRRTSIRTKVDAAGRRVIAGDEVKMTLWESAVLAGIGGGLTLIGTWAGARWQAREAQRARAEQFAREDRFRLHRDRMETYASFLRVAGAMRAAMTRPSSVLEDARKRRNALWQEYARLRLIGADQVAHVAESILELANQFVWQGAKFDDERHRALIASYVQCARSDLLGLVAADPGSHAPPDELEK